LIISFRLNLLIFFRLSIVNYQLLITFAPTFDQPLAKSVNVAQI